jgi:phosphoenolpyruvate synthase/pyruvate phosphate dikinase
MFRMIKELAYIKDVRDDFRTQGVFYSRKLVEEIGRRIGLSLKEVIFLTEEEIVSFLEDKKIDINNAKTRQNKFLLYFKNGKTVCIDKNIKEELAKLGFNLEDKKSADIKGLAACKGKAKGIAKIVKTTDEISKVNKGDILISVTTHPSYITAMQKAAAIVTDEGSLLCHAAIVSRELGIPCIVGTNTATSALKDGDLVEVDADKGVVRKI